MSVNQVVEHSMAQTPCDSLGDCSKVLFPLRFSHSFKLSERSLLLALLAATFKHFKVLSFFDPVHSCSNNLSIIHSSPQPWNFLQPAHSLHSSCDPIPLLGEWEQRLDYLSPLSMHSLQTLWLHSLHEFSGSNRETIETHSHFLSYFKHQQEITYTA